MAGSQPDRFPHSIVWTPIPLVTWLFPFIGHTGICDTNGVTFDFAGHFCVSEGAMAFGSPTRFFPLQFDSLLLKEASSEPIEEAWDATIRHCARVYRQRYYNFFTDNCHCFVGFALNCVGYGGRTDWNMAILGALVFFRARFNGVMGFVKTLAPFALVFALGLFFGGVKFLIAYACAVGGVLLVFLLLTYVFANQARAADTGPGGGSYGRDRDVIL